VDLNAAVYQLTSVSYSIKIIAVRLHFHGLFPKFETPLLSQQRTFTWTKIVVISTTAEL